MRHPARPVERTMRGTPLATPPTRIRWLSGGSGKAEGFAQALPMTTGPAIGKLRRLRWPLPPEAALRSPHEGDRSSAAARDRRAVCLAAVLGILAAGTAHQGMAADRAPAIPQMLPLRGDLAVHDPAMIREDDTFYLFATGNRRAGVLPIRCSKDLYHWTRCGSVFETLPDWATKEIPGARSLWAPDISHYNGKYHLYYSVSTFGKNNSAIGLATSRTLDPNRPDYKWVDEGLVVRSRPGRDDWNAIDPQLVIQDERNIWLCWGSFWGGIMMRRIEPATGKLSATDTTLHNLAKRPRGGGVEGSIEAPFIVRHEGWWYLFASFDFCCRGTKSTYNIRVGRSRNVTGPYVDRAGVPMTESGGTLVLEATTPNWRGPGHQAILQDISGDYLVFHAYHGQTGRSELKISTMTWEDGWPRVGALP